MSAKFAVLGLLIQREDYAYRLWQRLTERCESIVVPPQRVYRLLDTLTEEGLVGRTGVDTVGSNPNRSPRVVYSVTDLGVSRFEKWLHEPSPIRPLINDNHVKMTMAHPEDLPQLIEATVAQEQECLARLQSIEWATRTPRESAEDVDRWHRVAVVLVRNAEVGHLQATIQWLQRSRAVMERMRTEADAKPPQRLRSV